MQLNEWDSRHIEEPAYEARQEGYAAAKTLLATKDTWTVNCVLPVLYNALFTLNMVRVIPVVFAEKKASLCIFLSLVHFFLCGPQSEEMSLRDAAASFITYLLTNIETHG